MLVDADAEHEEGVDDERGTERVKRQVAGVADAPQAPGAGAQDQHACRTAAGWAGRSPRACVIARMRRTGARYAPSTPILGIWYQARST